MGKIQQVPCFAPAAEHRYCDSFYRDHNNKSVEYFQYTMLTPLLVTQSPFPSAVSTAWPRPTASASNRNNFTLPKMQSYSSPNALGPDGAAPFNYPNNNQQHHHSELSPTDEELQLTAQLSRGLGPNMNTGSGGAMTDGQDGQNHGGIQQQQHYGQEEHHTPALQANHSPMDQMGNQYIVPDDQSAPRKRSKVSRACDECRRKKVKCDAAEEGGSGGDCTGCKRVGMLCKFSRVPMKRGPSKGYVFLCSSTI